MTPMVSTKLIEYGLCQEATGHHDGAFIRTRRFYTVSKNNYLLLSFDIKLFLRSF